jgi:diacylglycerol kinase (ATP)
VKSALIINSMAGSLRGLTDPAEIRSHLAGLEADPEILVANTPTQITTAVNQLKSEAPQQVLIAGGDGTIARLFSELHQLPVTFGLIPTGSLNNIATSLGIQDIPKALKIINRGKSVQMDAGRASGKLFFESVGTGLLAEVMARVGEQDSKKEVLKVARHTLAEMINTEPLSVELTIDGRSHKLETFWLTVTNTGRAGAVEVDPAAKPYDQLLEVTYTSLLSKTQIPRSVISLLRGNHIQQRYFQRERGRRVHIKLTSQRHIHIDGELVKQQSIVVELVPKLISVYVA